MRYIKNKLSKYKILTHIYGMGLKMIDYSKSNLTFALNGGLNKEQIQNLKNIHSGKRCFIIGNGPSLKGSDLDKLKGEVTFAANRIDPIFRETKWRPKYYCAFDDGFIKNKDNHKYIELIDSDIKFLRKQGYYYSRKIKGNKCYLNTRYSRRYLKNPKFSRDISEYVYTIATVTYTSIQIAAYMGIKEIYFIGMDNSYANERLKDGTLIKNNETKNYFGNEEINNGFSAVYEMDIAYEAAKNYADKNGIKIYNATRGGKLEIFERVEFDTLFIK